MQITSGKVVSIDYTLTDDQQQTLDSSIGHEPLSYLHGSRQIIPGLEKALEGKSSGDQLRVTIEAKDAYGLRDESMVGIIPRSSIQGVPEIVPGIRLQARTPNGDVQILTVTHVEGDQVTVDGNHPLAGENLTFDVTVRDVRDATEEELAHGHAHGPGGHHHH